MWRQILVSKKGKTWPHSRQAGRVFLEISFEIFFFHPREFFLILFSRVRLACAAVLYSDRKKTRSPASGILLSALNIGVRALVQQRRSISPFPAKLVTLSYLLTPVCSSDERCEKTLNSALISSHSSEFNRLEFILFLNKVCFSAAFNFTPNRFALLARSLATILLRLGLSGRKAKCTKI